jgi:hypothetical protein
MAEWFMAAVLKTDSAFLANRTNQSKPLCPSASCNVSDFTLIHFISRVLTRLMCHLCVTLPGSDFFSRA